LAACSEALTSDGRRPVLAHGIDVLPSSAAIYVSDFEKAWEYGGFPKLILAIKHDGLASTFTVVDADTSTDELTSLRGEYPTEKVLPDGRRWFSHLAADDKAVGTGYELAYARRIPGDPLASVLIVLRFVLVPSNC
jgi:hypothetical protein